MKVIDFSSTPKVCLICDCILNNMTKRNEHTYFCQLIKDENGNETNEKYGPLCHDCQEYLESAGRVKMAI